VTPRRVTRPRGAAYVLSLAALLLTGCTSGGSNGGGGHASPTPRVTITIHADRGPACAGNASRNAAVVLRGGTLPLPGGDQVTYNAGYGTGATRTATLALSPDGTRGVSHAKVRTVRPGDRLTVRRHVFTVDQICTYHVLFTPVAAADRAALAKRPSSLGGNPTTKADERAWCFSTDPTVRAAAARWVRAKGTEFGVLDTGPQNLPDGESLVSEALNQRAGTAWIQVTCGEGTPVAVYETRVGDTVEISGSLFRVARVVDHAVRLERLGG
jgi:hypothetical protein